MDKHKVIIDGDWGGDEMQLASVLAAHPDKVDILGATATFGNTHHDQVLRNAGNILHFLKAGHLPYYPGARCPSGVEDQPVGDGAHGSDGIGNVGLEAALRPPEQERAVDFILKTLRENSPGTVTITASGPLANIAQAWRQDPETMKHVGEIIIMGGCTEDMPAADRPLRRGNITHHAEFNFQQAPQDARDVLSSGLPITLLPMNCTHQLTVTEARKNIIEEAFQNNPRARNRLIGMMTAPAELDRRKFNSDPVMHDVHCALYLLHPEEYITQKGRVAVTIGDANPEFFENKNGRTDFIPDENSRTRVASGVKDPDKLFGIFMSGIKTCLAPRQKMLHPLTGRDETERGR